MGGGRRSVRMGGGQEVGNSRAEGASGSVSVEQVSQVGWSQVMEGFVCQEEDLVLNSLGDGEPVELDEDGGDVFTDSGVGE